nr:hypothetical protein Itr_chr12CG31920 [Ipomoea trifida]
MYINSYSSCYFWFVYQENKKEYAKNQAPIATTNLCNEFIVQLPRSSYKTDSTSKSKIL